MKKSPSRIPVENAPPAARRRIGYARISTQEQDPQMQVEALEKAGCERVFVERISGASRTRPILDKALAELRPGDTLTVWKLDRLDHVPPSGVGGAGGRGRVRRGPC